MRKPLLIILIFIFHKHSTYGYRASVLEYYSLTADSSENTILKNLEQYREHADIAKAQGVDIIIYPEYGLTTLDHDPEKYAIEVKKNSTVINELHTIALERNIYLVVNLLEKEQEASNNTKYFNTNLVFNRQGEIIHKYRKINLFNEKKLTPGDVNQNLIFSTDFGVIFGLFTGFDILFHNPSRRVLNDVKVTDIIFPTAWSAQMPFFTSLSMQHGYSISNGVNLLAANYGRPKDGYGGSGIYLANGKIAEVYISDSASSKQIVQEIAKMDKRNLQSFCSTPLELPDELSKSNVTNYNTKKYFQSSDYKFKNVEFSGDKESIDICDGSFCCNFEIKFNQTKIDKNEYYKVMAYDGVSSYGDVKAHTRICSLLACESDEIASCGNRINVTNTQFFKITVQGNLKNDDETFYMPISLTSFLLPIKETNFCSYDNGTNSTFVEFGTTKVQDNVIVFGIFGKTLSTYNLDIETSTVNSFRETSTTSTARTSIVRFDLFCFTVYVVIRLS